MTKIHTDNWIDAQEMAKHRPETFSAPDLEDLEKICVGDLAKVCRRDIDGENTILYWTIITEINGDDVIAEVNNFLKDDGVPYNAGDKVAYQKRHIYAVYERWFIEDYLRVPPHRIYQKICLGCNQIATIESKRENHEFWHEGQEIPIKVSFLECNRCGSQFDDPDFDVEKFKKMALDDHYAKINK